jgi:hypothetical protein
MIGRAIVALWSAFTMLIGCTTAAPPATKPAATAPELPPGVALQQAISMLTREGRQAKTQQKWPRNTADFAATFPQSLDAGLVGTKVAHHVVDDPFVDAYVRWQLTSFKPVLPEMTDAQFESVLTDLPALMDSPRADSVLIAQLTSATSGNPLDKKAQDLVNGRIRAMERRSEQIEAFNRAPIEFRQWIREQTATRPGHQPLWPILAEIEDCLVLVRGGWSVDAAKNRLDALCTAAGNNHDLPAAQRQKITDHLATLSGIRNAFIRNARIQDNNLTVDFGEAAVDDFEVRKWTKMTSSTQ